MQSGLQSADGLGTGRGRARTLLFLLVLPLVLIGPALLPGRRFLPQSAVALEPLATEYPEAAERAREQQDFLTSDRLFPTLTDQLALREAVRAGVLPTWEPRLGLGVPLFAGTIAAAAYPPNWLALLLPPDLAAGPLAVAMLFLAGLGLYLFLRRLGLQPGACLVGALALQVGGFGIGNLHYFMKVGAAAWLPWSLWAVEGLVQRKPRSGLALVLALGLSLLAGFPPIAIFCFAATVGWAALRLLGAARIGTWREVQPIRRRVALYLVLGLAAGAWQMLPSYEASRQSLRSDRGPAEMRNDSLPASTALGLVVPDLFGTPTEPVFAPGHPVAWALTSDKQRALTANPLEWNTYVGAGVLLLALVALVATPRRAAAPFLGALLCLGFAQGWPVVRWLFYVPGLALGEPSRVLAVAWVLWPWLAALGLDALVARRPRALGAGLAAGFALTATAFLFWRHLDPGTWAASLAAELAERHGLPIEEVRAVVTPEVALAAGERLVASAGRVFAFGFAFLIACLQVLFLGRGPDSSSSGTPPWKLAAGLGFVLLAASLPLAGELAPRGASATCLLAAGLLALIGVAWYGERRGTLGAWLPIALVIAFEGLLVSPPHLVPRPAEPEGYFPPSEALAKVAEAAGDGRVLRFDDSPSGVEQVLQLARPNMLQAYGISDLTPFIALTPRYLVELLEELDARTRYRSGASRLPDLRLLDHPVLDIARVTAILSTRPLEHPRLVPVYAREGFHVYHRTGALPVVRVVPLDLTSTSDEQAIRRLADGDLDPLRQVVLAPGVVPGQQLEGDHRQGELRVSRPAPNRLDVQLAHSSGGWLVMHEAWAPGWKATIDGRDAELVRADHACRAVRVPAGDSLVRTWYEPWSLRLGFSATVAAVLGALALAWREQRVSRASA